MRRREFIFSAAGATVAMRRDAIAQRASGLSRVGLLNPGGPLDEGTAMGAAFLRGMADLGYVPGQNFVVDARGAGFRMETLPHLAQDLAAAGSEVIVTNGFPTVLAAKATGLPVVAAGGIGDPVATGLVQSLARPGGNVTGVSDIAAELTAKRIELLKELAPRLRRIAMLWNENDLAMTLRYKISAETAERLGATVQALGVRGPDDFETAFAAMRREIPDAMLVVSDWLTVNNRRRLFEFALRYRLPAIYEPVALVRDGGLMSYGAELREVFGRAAALTVRILKGVKPADLPFEQPTRYHFAINLKTANAMGLDIPPILLARANEVIE